MVRPETGVPWGWIGVGYDFHVWPPSVVGRMRAEAAAPVAIQAWSAYGREAGAARREGRLSRLSRRQKPADPVPDLAPVPRAEKVRPPRGFSEGGGAWENLQWG